MFGDRQKQTKQKEESSQDQNENTDNYQIQQLGNKVENKKSKVQNIFQYFNELFVDQTLKSQNEKATLQMFSVKKIIRLIYQQKNTFSSIIESFLQKSSLKKCESMATQFRILSIKGTKYCEVVEVQMQFSWYKTQVQILNCIEPSPIHSCAQLDSCGSFGTVYFIDFEHESLAIKCISFDFPQSDLKQRDVLEIKQKTVISALKEYFFLLLFSTLQIGPKVKKIMGFDLIITRQCIEFSMQRCEKRQITEHGQKQLKQALKVMHAHQIVHRDIKPDNIMYSKSFEKYVFIDFGGSTVIQQFLGQKTKSTFIGTTNYCSPEMLSLLTKKTGYVDLYYNDLFALLKTLQRINIIEDNSQQRYEILFQEDNMKGLNTLANKLYLQIERLKYVFYTENYEDLDRVWKKIQKRHFHMMQEISVELMRFFMELQLNRNISLFYLKYLDQFIQQYEEFQSLRKLFLKYQNSILSKWQQYPLKKTLFNTEINFYKSLYINYGNFIIIQKEVMEILMNKMSIQQFIFSQNYTQQQKCNEDFIVKYCLVVMNYCTLAENKYDAEMSMKINACQKAINILENEKNQHFEKMNLLFQPNQKELNLLVLFLQYFILKIWHKIPQIFKDKLMIHSLSSLFLLGYPNYLIKANALVRHQFIKGSSSRVKKIITFWKFILVSLNFGNILYDLNEDDFFCNITQEEKKQINKTYQEVMKKDQSQKQSFFNLNNFFIVNLYENEDLSSQQILQSCLLHLNKEIQFEQISDQDYIDWRITVTLVLRFRYLAFQAHNHISIQYIFQKKKKYSDVLEIKSESLLFFFIQYFQTKQYWQVDSKIKLLFKFVDQIINYPQLSIKYMTEERLKLSYYEKDFQKSKDISQMIVMCAKQNSSITFQRLCKVTGIIKDLVSIEMNKIQDRNERINEFKKCYFDLIIKKACQLMTPIWQTKFSQNPQMFLNQLQDKRMSSNSIFLNLSKIRGILFNLRNICKNITFEQQEDKLYNIDFNIQRKTIHKQELYIIILKQTEIFIKNVGQYQDFKKYRKNDQIEKNFFFNYILNQLLQSNQYEKVIEIFQKQFNLIRVQQLFNSSISYKPSLRLFILYSMIKTKTTNYAKSQCNNLIEIYYRCNHMIKIIDPMTVILLYQYIYCAFVYCNRSFQQIFNLLLFITNQLKAISTKNIIREFVFNISQKISCYCLRCFPKKTQNWNHTHFILYLSQKCIQLNPRDHAYMSLVYFKCLSISELPSKIKRKFACFIMNSIQFLNSHAKDQIISLVYSYWFDVFHISSGLKQLYTELQSKSNFYFMINKQNDNKEIKDILTRMFIKFDKKILKKHAHMHLKCLRNIVLKMPLQLLADQTLYYVGNLQERRKLKTKIISKYRMKLMKLFFVNQNYLPQYPPSQIEMKFRQETKFIRYQIFENVVRKKKNQMKPSFCQKFQQTLQTQKILQTLMSRKQKIQDSKSRDV